MVSVDMHMFGSNGSVHDSNIIESFAGIMVYSQPVLGAFMLPAHVAEDEVCFSNFADVLSIDRHSIVQTLTEYCSET